MKKISINIPSLIKTDDYHDLDGIAQTVSKLTSKKIKSIEIGYEIQRQRTKFLANVGVLYTGKKPSMKIIKELVQKEKTPLENLIILHERI